MHNAAQLVNTRVVMDQRQQGRILALRIRETLQIQSILAHLNELGLLTANERDVLKGRNALHRFIVCLQRSSSDALRHEELARLLGRRGHTRVTVRRK